MRDALLRCTNRRDDLTCQFMESKKTDSTRFSRYGQRHRFHRAHTGFSEDFKQLFMAIHPREATASSAANVCRNPTRGFPISDGRDASVWPPFGMPHLSHPAQSVVLPPSYPPSSPNPRLLGVAPTIWAEHALRSRTKTVRAAQGGCPPPGCCS